MRTVPTTRPGAGAASSSSTEDSSSSSSSSDDDVSSAAASSGAFAQAAIMPARPPSCDRWSGRFGFVDGAGAGARSARIRAARRSSARAQSCEQ